jgi:hypothetical protein
MDVKERRLVQPYFKVSALWNSLTSGGPVMLRELDNFDRRMYLVRFNNSTETLMFSNEVEM